MNELDELRGIRQDVAPMSARAQSTGRQRLASAMAAADGRSRPHPRRRLAFAAVGMAVVGLAGAAVVVSLNQAEAVPPQRRAKPVHMDLAAWSVNTNQDGSVSVTVRQVGDLFNPAALEKALADAGVPAIVKVGPCHWANLRDTRMAVRLQNSGTGGPQFLITVSAIPKHTQLVFDIALPWTHASNGQPPTSYAMRNDVNGGEIAVATGATAGHGLPGVSGASGVVYWGLAPVGGAVTC